jgi:hypothetical protein
MAPSALKLQNRSEGLINFSHLLWRKGTEALNEPIGVDDSYLLAKEDRVRFQSPLPCFDQHMAWKLHPSDFSSERGDDRMRACRISPVCLNDEHWAGSGLLGASGRGKIGQPNLSPLYCHRISPLASSSS